jgi:hypothetical protein
MSRRKQLPYVMTLRLDRQLSDDLENLSFSIRTSRAALIRRLLRLAVQGARQLDAHRYEAMAKEISL